jgi:hypothetical protein
VRNFFGFDFILIPNPCLPPDFPICLNILLACESSFQAKSDLALKDPFSPQILFFALKVFFKTQLIGQS